MQSRGQGGNLQLSLIPVIGAVSSCLCLSEPFYWKYIIAGALATAGIYVINKGK